MLDLVSLGLFVPLVAKPEKVNDVAEFLSAGYDLVQAEEETIQWYGIKYSDHTPTTFAIFDTFLSEGGRVKHVEGKVAEALMANAGELLGPAPAISKVELLANKVTPLSGGRTGRTAGLSVGLRVFLTAKPEKAKAVRDFLIVSFAFPLHVYDGAYFNLILAAERTSSRRRRVRDPCLVRVGIPGNE